MKKTIIISIITLVIASTFIVIQSKGVDDTSDANLTGNAELQRDEKPLNLTAKNKDEISTDAPIKSENKTQDTPLKKDAFKCFKLTQIQKEISKDTFEKFANENTLHPASVQQYLTKLDKNELIAEFEAGNTSAAYVLGLNIFFSSYNTTFHHPSLTSTMRIEGNKSTKINIEKLNEARKWLWVAAINGVSSGLAEISATYNMERSFLEADYDKNQGGLTDIEKRLKILKTKQLLYNILHVEVAPQVYDLFGVGIKHYKDQLEQIQLEEKEQLYKEIETQWIEDRFNLNQPKEIELVVPDEIKIAAQKISSQC